jgi:hypothetical protein
VLRGRLGDEKSIQRHAKKWISGMNLILPITVMVIYLAWVYWSFL